MKTIKTTIRDPAEYLKTDEEVTAYLNDVFLTNDSRLIVAAIGDVIRARDMPETAESAEYGKEGLYEALYQNGNPSFETVIEILSSFGYGLYPQPIAL